MWAEEVFGKEHVAHAIDARREGSKQRESELQSTVESAPPRSQPEPAPVEPPAAPMISLQAIDQTMRGLLNMGFAKPDVKKTVDTLVHRHRNDTEPVKLPELIREAIAALT